MESKIIWASVEIIDKIILYQNDITYYLNDISKEIANAAEIKMKELCSANKYLKIKGVSNQ